MSTREATPEAPPEMAAAAASEADPRRRARFPDAPAFLVGLTMAAVFVVLGQKGGGFEPTRWMPAALFVLGLVAAVLVGASGDVRLGRRQAVALAALAGFAAWSYTSLLWADVRGDAWVGANRTLLYTAVFALFLLVPWTPRAAQAVAWSFAAGVTAVAAFAIVRVTTTDDDTFFIDGRFAYPTEYPNANVALFIAGFWIALAIAVGREQPIVARALALGAVVFLPQAALIVQSRAALLAVPIAALVVLAVTPGRLRTGLGLAIALTPLAIGWDIHLGVYEKAEVDGGSLRDAMEKSAAFMAITSASAVLLGLAWALADRRLELTPRASRVLHVLAAVTAAAALLFGAVLVARSDPVERVRVGWSELTTNEIDYEGGTRFESLEGERWDHWRVGIGRFLDRPVAGIGVEQFNVDYLRERRTSVDARYAHSLWVGVLSQLGVVGAILFGTFVVLICLLARPKRSDVPVVRTVRLGAFALVVYWLIHSSVDWFYEIPAITASTVAFAGLAAALAPSASRATAAPRDRHLRIAVAAALVAVAAAAVAIAVPYLAERDVRRAVAVWSVEPETAYDLLERAATLNPLADEPDLYAGAIAARLDDRARMRRHFSRALERNPHNWYAHLELGLTYSLDGRRRAALREVRLALRLNPTEEILMDTIERLERGETVAPGSVDRLFADRLIERLR